MCSQGSRVCSHPQRSSRTDCFGCTSEGLQERGRVVEVRGLEAQRLLLLKMGLRVEELRDCGSKRLTVETKLSNILGVLQPCSWVILSIILQFEMSNRTWNEPPQQRIQLKLKETQHNKQKAIQSRTRELERELSGKSGPSQQMQVLSTELEDFRGKMKGLYTSIFQGSKELSIRKSDLVRQIRGNDQQENQPY